MPKLMIVACVSSAKTCIVHARDDELHMLMAEGLIPMHCDKLNSDSTTNDVRYKPLEHCDEEVDCHNAIKQSDQNPKTDWREDPNLPNKYLAYSEKSIEMLT